MGGSPSFTIPILVAPERYSGTEVEGRICPLVQRVRVSTVDMRSYLSHCQHAGGKVTTEILNIVGDEAGRAGSGAMAISASALEFDAN